MSRFSRMLALFAVPVLITACSSGGPDTPLSPAGIRHDGGTPMLGGNATPPDSTTAGNTSTTSTSSDGTLSDGGAESTPAGGTPILGGN